MTPDTSTHGQNSPVPDFGLPEPGYSYTQPLKNEYDSEILDRKPLEDSKVNRLF